MVVETSGRIINLSLQRWNQSALNKIRKTLALSGWRGKQNQHQSWPTAKKNRKRKMPI